MMNLIWKRLNKKGFTLIELIVVIAILGILAAVLIPRFTGFQAKAKATKALVDAKQIATALDAYYIENSAWPADGDEIMATAGLVDGTDGDLNLDTDGGFTWTLNDADGGGMAGRTNGAETDTPAGPVKMNVGP